MSDTSTNFLLAGVGGQGILLAADVLGLLGMEMAFDVKKSEVHGMAQRGGSVTSHVRWGEVVWSPLISPGEVDYLIACERLEALRYADMVRPGGTLLIGDYRIPPVSVSSGNETYPTEAEQEAAFARVDLRTIYVPAVRIAKTIGGVRVHNVVMLGALSALLDVSCEVWLEVISGRVPRRYAELNRKAFLAGRAFVAGR